MRPFFTYYGGKYRAASRYPSPRHDTIVEPFAGSAGYSVRFNAPRVILIDLDPNIEGVWRYLINASEDEIRSLPDIGPGQNLSDFPVPEEARLLIGWWLNKATTHPCNTPGAWMRGHEFRSQFWGPEVRERLASQVSQIRHWEIRQCSYADAPDIEATWFVDPPYQRSGGSRYRFGSRQLDYEDLAAWCRSRSGQVIVCEGPGADWLPFEHAFYGKGTEGKGRTGISSEMVWYGDVNEEAA